MKMRVSLIVSLMMCAGVFFGMCETAVYADANIGKDEACSRVSNRLKKAAGCSENKEINTVLVSAIKWFMGVVATSGIITMIAAGFKMSMSAGDAGKVKQARSMMAYGIVGIVVAISAFVIVNFLLSKIQ